MLGERNYLPPPQLDAGEQCSSTTSLRRGTRVSTRQRFHSDRAEIFQRHASSTKNLDTREMYLRLARMEIALAVRLAVREAALAEQLEQQTPREAEVPATNERANES
jgi:hypothetical protein